MVTPMAGKSAPLDRTDGGRVPKPLLGISLVQLGSIPPVENACLPSEFFDEQQERLINGRTIGGYLNAPAFQPGTEARIHARNVPLCRFIF